MSSLMDVVSNIVEKDPAKYMKLMGDSMLMKPFLSGYGYAAGVLGTMMTSKSDKLSALKKMLGEMKKGWEVGTGDMKDQAIEFMLKPSGKGKGIRISRILKNIIGGGSQLQQMVKAYSGDAKAVAEIIKRVFNIVYAQLKDMMSSNADDIIAKIPGAKGLEDQGKKDLLTSLQGGIASMFGVEGEAEAA